MNIGILGAGNIGGNLGQIWARKGHAVMYGVRDPHSPKVRKALAASGPGARVGNLLEAAAFGQVVVLAVPWTAVKETLSSAGNLSGKVLIDTTNRFVPLGPDETPNSTADVSRWAAGARVVKAFNTIGAESLLHPQFGGERITTFILGDDAAAKQAVMSLAGDIGLDPVDAGSLANAELLEVLTRLWVQLTRNYGRDIGWKVLRREA